MIKLSKRPKLFFWMHGTISSHFSLMRNITTHGDNLALFFFLSLKPQIPADQSILTGSDCRCTCSVMQTVKLCFDYFNCLISIQNNLFWAFYESLIAVKYIKKQKWKTIFFSLLLLKWWISIIICMH